MGFFLTVSSPEKQFSYQRNFVSLSWFIPGKCIWSLCFLQIWSHLKGKLLQKAVLFPLNRTSWGMQAIPTIILYLYFLTVIPVVLFKVLTVVIKRTQIRLHDQAGKIILGLLGKSVHMAGYAHTKIVKGIRLL